MKKFKFHLFLMIFFTSTVLPFFSQTSSATVTDISVLVSNMTVQITWKRPSELKYSPDISFRIYRDTKPLNSKSITSKTLIAEQDSSQLIFSEELPDSSSYYYAVLIAKNEELINTLVIANVNSTTKPIYGIDATRNIYKPSGISNLNVISENGQNIITFTSVTKGNLLFLYKSKEPFTNKTQLYKAVKVASFIDTGEPYIDKTNNTEKYYYALLEEKDVSSGEIRFIKGKNTTDAASKSFNTQDETVSSNINNINKSRKTPLPTVTNSVQGTNSMILSEQTNQMLYDLSKTNDKNYTYNESTAPFIFPQELSGNEEVKTALGQIIDRYFITENWIECEKELTQFINSTKSPTQEKRAHFYLGEIYYFTKNKREALLQFLETREEYPRESTLWINKVLENF